MADPSKINNSDHEDNEADRFALELLTGTSEFDVQASTTSFNATQLADAATVAARGLNIDPAILALCLGHRSGRWRQAFGALKILEGTGPSVGAAINQIAGQQIDWSAVPSDAADYLRAVLGVD